MYRLNSVSRRDGSGLGHDSDHGEGSRKNSTRLADCPPQVRDSYVGCRGETEKEQAAVTRKGHVI
jgi:hypothetical protein